MRRIRYLSVCCMIVAHMGQEVVNMGNIGLIHDGIDLSYGIILCIYN